MGVSSATYLCGCVVKAQGKWSVAARCGVEAGAYPRLVGRAAALLQPHHSAGLRGVLPHRPLTHWTLGSPSTVTLQPCHVKTCSRQRNST